MKKAIAYLLYLSGLLLLIFLGGKYQQELRILAGREFNPLPPILFSTAYSILMGMYIALPGLAGTLKKSGKLGLDWLKVLIIGIPTLLITASGILYYYLGWNFGLLLQWMNIQYNGLSAFIGAVGGYTLISSISKDETAETISTGKKRVAKIVTLAILGTFILYISLHGIINPVKLVDVNADIATTDNQVGYMVKEGTESVFLIQTDITYTFTFENLSHSRQLSFSGREQKIWIEPKEKLQRLVDENLFQQFGGTGFGNRGNQAELRLTYNLGSIDPEGNHANKQPPSPEFLAEIKDALYDADLVIQINDNKILRFNLLEYKKSGILKRH